MRILAYDSETSIGTTIHGSDFRDPNNDVYTQIFGLADSTVLLEHFAQGFKRKLARSLEDVDLLIGHNLAFDLSYIWHDAIFKEFLLKGGQIWDTQQAEYTLTGQQHSNSSLAELALKHLGENTKPARITQLYKKGVGADKIVQARKRCPRLWKLYEEYCESDGITPIKVYEAQLKIAKETGMLNIVRLRNAYVLSLINMACTGVLVDTHKCEQTQRDLNLKAVECLQELNELIKDLWNDERLPEFNINSPDQKSALLFGGKLSVKVRKRVGDYKNGNPKFKTFIEDVVIKGFKIPTKISRPAAKKGFYSTDSKVMSNIYIGTKNPVLRRYYELQKLSMNCGKVSKTYCKAFLDRSVDGVLYPEYNTALTKTSRLSSRRPNLQNIPSKGDLGGLIESILVAKPGYKCVSIDFSQLEKWVQAWISKDENLIERLLNGMCLHCFMLAQKLKKPYEEVYRLAVVDQVDPWPSLRKNIKPVSFQMDYGAMPPKVALTTGLALDEVKAIFKLDKDLYPQKHEFFDDVLPALIENNYQDCRKIDIPKKKQKGKYRNGVALLPIFDKNGLVHYNEEYIQRVGYWSTEYGKKYHFLETGRQWSTVLKRGFSFTQPKNYPNQGGASDIQAITTVALFQTLLRKSDKIEMFMEIHDSKRFYVREDVLGPCLKWLKDTIEDVPNLFKEWFGIEVPFKFPVTIDVGDDFGNMITYKTEK